jgi:hypothetical protein
MPAKMLALTIQASLALVAWWATRTDDERRAMQAAAWRELESLAMRLAKSSSNVAAYAERRYKETVSIG